MSRCASREAGVRAPLLRLQERLDSAVFPHRLELRHNLIAPSCSPVCVPPWAQTRVLPRQGGHAPMVGAPFLPAVEAPWHLTAVALPTEANPMDAAPSADKVQVGALIPV